MTIMQERGGCAVRWFGLFSFTSYGPIQLCCITTLYRSTTECSVVFQNTFSHVKPALLLRAGSALEYCLLRWNAVHAGKSPLKFGRTVQSSSSEAKRMPCRDQQEVQDRHSTKYSHHYKLRYYHVFNRNEHTTDTRPALGNSHLKSSLRSSVN
ncbi:uncharacterized protein LOC111865221 [Cryptotermes secundus]|uniref:uncharacterized protein LOC111865221 n=1 Tax=Cryptotermes secundus TaxID=105785 RepID=UPI001454C9AC|nr:uncharacterized protein LOC111865221 [Cryptotermes secundus]